MIISAKSFALDIMVISLKITKVWWRKKIVVKKGDMGPKVNLNMIY